MSFKYKYKYKAAKIFGLGVENDIKFYKLN